jgi:hypothetical protein
MQRLNVSLILALALASACRGGGSGPTTPVEPTYRLVMPGPCQTQPPVEPGPVLLEIPSCGEGVEGVCPPLTPGQIDAVWQYIEELETYAWSSYRCEARRSGGSVPGSSGQGADAADP